MVCMSVLCTLNYRWNELKTIILQLIDDNNIKFVIENVVFNSAIIENESKKFVEDRKIIFLNK